MEPDDITPHQPDIPSDVEQDDFHEVAFAPRPQKRPFSEWGVQPDEISDSDEQPDLHLYFSKWDIEEQDQLVLCRSYANYLKAKLVAKDPKEKSKKRR